MTNAIKRTRAVITLDAEAGAEGLGREGAKVFFVGMQPGIIRRALLSVYVRSRF